MAKDTKSEKEQSGGEGSEPTTQVLAAAATAVEEDQEAQRSAKRNAEVYKEQWDHLRETGRLPSGYGRSGAFIFPVKG